MAQEVQKAADRQEQKWAWTNVVMLAIIMGALCLVFLWGMKILVNAKAPGAKEGFDSADIVAVLSPALAVISTIAAGVFGYSLGSAGTVEAQQVASAATQEVATAREEASVAAAPLVRSVQRIVSQAEAGSESEPGKRHISLDDLKSLLDGTAPIADRLRRRGGF